MPVGRYVKKGVSNAKKLAKDYYKKKGVKGVAEDAWKGVQYLNKLVNSELKSVTSGVVNQGISYNGISNHLTPIAQGDLHNQRNGSSVLLRFIQLRGKLSIGSNPSATTVKIMVVQDRQKNYSNVDPPVSDIFEVMGSERSPYSYIPVNQRKRFKILATKYITLNQAGRQSQMFNFNIKHSRHCKWEFNSTNRLEGHIYLFMISDQNGIGNEPTLDYTWKTKYHDN